MNRRKFKKRHALITSFPVVPKSIKRETLKEVGKQYLLSEGNRLTYIYKTDLQGKVREVTCVSYEIEIENDWITIAYLDNVHAGILHMHIRTSIENLSDPATTLAVTKKTDPKKQLTWAIHYLNNSYLDYKRGFLKRSKTYLTKNKVEVY